MEKNISIKDSMNELLETDFFKEISRRNGDRFATKLALWLIRYILVISSINESLEISLEMILSKLRYILVISSINESLEISLEMILSKLHGEDNFQKILKLTEKIFDKVYNESISQLSNK
jgi:hypothetical protein